MSPNAPNGNRGTNGNGRSNGRGAPEPAAAGMTLASKRQPRAGIAEEPIDRIAQWLDLRVGAELTAFTVQVSAQDVGRMVAGELEPEPPAERRLRNLYAVAWFMVTRDGPGSAYDFLVEPNPELDHRSPVEMLREGSSPESVWFAAATQF
jgi:hypothetical protein